MRNITGTPVGGADFFGRDKELQQLRMAVEDGNHVLLSAPRRVGKSSLVGKLSTVLGQSGWRVAEVDVQGVADEVGFVELFSKGLQAAGIKISWWDWVVDRVKVIRSLVQPGAHNPDHWKEIADRIEQLLREAGPKREHLLVAIDELPIFLTNLGKEPGGPERVAHFLHWLRSARHAGNPAVRWVVCGSIGLDSFVEARKLAGTVNDFQVRTLGAFTDETAIKCLQALGGNPKYNLPLDDAACRRILDRIGWPLPYYVQLMFNALQNVRPDGQTPPGFPTPDDIEAAFKLLLNPDQAFQFSHWDTRLDDQFSDPADAGVARFLLNQICRHPKGRSRDALQADLVARQPNADVESLERRLRAILELLERDGYLLRSGNDYAFRSFLLRAYWERRFA